MSEQENINEKVKENGKKVFFVLVSLIVAAVILVFLIKLLFVNNKINQGKFRVSDALLTSVAEFIDKSDETGKWSYDVWQNNVLTLLINTSDTEISRAYISDVQSFRNGIELSQKDSEITLLSDSQGELDLLSDVSDDGTVIYEINITNKKALESFEVPEDITEITHDATFFAYAGIDEEDLTFSISFNLNIQETNGNENVMKVELDLPQGDITQTGTNVTRLDLNNFVFKLK